MATPEELLTKLEERFILGEISEASYNELKAKFEAKLAGNAPSPAEGQNIGEGNVIKGDITSTTGAAQVGNVVVNVPGADSPAQSGAEIVICPLCGLRNESRQTFRCMKCQRDHLCRDHFDTAAHACMQCVAKDESLRAEGQRQLPPASFATLVSSLATQAMTALGGFSDPNSEKVMVDIELAKHHIDTLKVLEEKTKGNLEEDETKLMEEASYQVQMLFVQVAQHISGQQGQTPGQPPAAGPA